MILAADIGGTNARFALFQPVNHSLEMVDLHKYPSRQLTSLPEATTDYLRKNNLWQSEKIKAAWFSLAGPISGDNCRFTNLELTVDLASLREQLGFIPIVGWSNDLVALGYGISVLPDRALHLLSGKALNEELLNSVSLNSGPLNRAVIAPGTGLGESLIIGGQVYPTEGAHADFAPQVEEDLELWRFLHRRYGHVSYERLLSGEGLTNIYDFLRDRDEVKGNGEAAFKDLSPQEISNKALAKECRLCVEALHIFVRLLGAEAGNLALKSFAQGGVYLGGGIPPKIIDKLKDGTFQAAFADKGRFSNFLAEIPVYLILEENTPLLGAAHLALRRTLA
ncbi:MAG: glucokinase [Peptococcaceae bacterium]|jgi:glucokinase|nr:glucokinase [Peptococcaceae bacterium]